ncbi:pheromone A receptor-domain-containing protein [Lanmaoa asiatica]|nr:pheromone A receptor-domain-containing protein [Lanmaoa asiatica]
MYPEVPALSFISAALTLVPLIWYFHARNIAAMAIGIWFSVTNLTYAVDALVWAENVDIVASVWCDISTCVITGSRIALPAACLSVCVHLERLAAFCQTSIPQAKRRRIIFECLMCFGLPVMYIALHLVVQPRRFDLFYGFGCRPATYPTVVTIFLVMIPPLLLTVAAIVCAGIAWRHFLVHGVQFYGKRGSISSLTRNLYLRLVGMALLEAVFSAFLVAVVMWGVLFPGLAPIGNMPRHLSEVLIRGPDAITDNIRTVLKIEWSVTVVQSIVFFGLFACRMEVAHEGWERIRSFLRLLKRSNPSVMPGQGISKKSMGSSVPTLPITVVDLSLVIQSASTLTPYGHSIDKSLPSTPGTSRPPSPVEDASEDIVISAIVPAMIPLESPSRASAIASSHNSLESNFDPGQLLLPSDAWPRTPTSIPARLLRRSFSVGYTPKQDLSQFNMDVPFPRAKPAVHVRSCTADSYTKPPGCGLEKRQAIYVTVVKETQYDPPPPLSFFLMSVSLGPPAFLPPFQKLGHTF